jgi:hypothetical protein
MTPQGGKFLMKSNRFALYALSVLALLCFAGISRAESPFNGTWKTDITQAKFDPKPLVFYISGGWYHCVSCTPAYDVAADGQFHAVAGQSFDEMSVTIVDDHTVSFATRKNGKVASESTRTVSPDGKMLSVHVTSHPKDSDKTLTFDEKARRDGLLRPGVQPISGKWILLQEKGSDDAFLTTYKVDGDQISMTQPDGENYTATLGGGDAPYKGAYGVDTVSVRRINPNTIEETGKRGGQVIDVYTMTVTGKTMTIVEEGKLSGRITHLVAHKQ